MSTKTIMMAGLLTTALSQAAFADSDQVNTCIDMALDAVDIPEARTYHDGLTETATKALETETHLASISAQILPTTRPEERTRIQFNAKFLDESDEADYYDVYASISFMFNDQGHYVEDLGDIFDAGVWIEEFNPDGTHHYDPTPRLERDEREIWVSQSATAAAFIFSHCMGMDRIMPLGYDTKSAAQPQFPVEAFE